MIKIKKNPYRLAEISPEDAYKLGEVLELIYRLEITTAEDKTSIARAMNVESYINKLTSRFSSNSKIYFDKGRKDGEKQSFEIFNVLNKKQLKKYQNSLIEEVDLLKYKNNL